MVFRIFKNQKQKKENKVKQGREKEKETHPGMVSFDAPEGE